MPFTRRRFLQGIGALALSGSTAKTAQARDLLATESVERFALLIGAPIAADGPAMQNDVHAMQKALALRGFTSEQMLLLCGPVHRNLLTAVLKDVSQRIQDWKQGELFVFVSCYTDIRSKDLDPFYRLSLQTSGDARLPLAGRKYLSAGENRP